MPCTRCHAPPSGSAAAAARALATRIKPCTSADPLAKTSTHASAAAAAVSNAAERLPRATPSSPAGRATANGVGESGMPARQRVGGGIHIGRGLAGVVAPRCMLCALAPGKPRPRPPPHPPPPQPSPLHPQQQLVLLARRQQHQTPPHQVALAQHRRLVVDLGIVHPHTPALQRGRVGWGGACGRGTRWRGGRPPPDGRPPPAFPPHSNLPTRPAARP